MKNLYVFISSFLLIFISNASVNAITISRDVIIPPTGRDMLNTSADGTSLLDYVFTSARDIIFGLLTFIAIAVFLFIGARLVVARGNPEEFSKAIKSFVYAAVGIFVIVFAWAAVRLISGITL